MKSFMLAVAAILCLFSCDPAPQNPLCELAPASQEEYTFSKNRFDFYPKTLRAFNDFDAGVACAQRQNKPIFLLFTGYGTRVHFFPDIALQDPAILSYLYHDFIPIILYVDDRKKLPLAEQEMVKTENGFRQFRNVGNKNAYLQERMFRMASQPYLVLMTWQGEVLTKPLGYSPDISVYVNALEVALDTFRKKQAFLKEVIIN
ncbi:hypothetical protein [Aureispira anguillae]|uniref:Uncharacterized protein n=1 Tax=Aureispira anguillae TaxID=2864201 RepID=A0A915YFV9_9BACT|nr:hypothetical protein [Aureispira anguillae]BDS12270.1 hypothetical protein AsAng_0029890 [Aureispira anguillae]